MTTIATDTSAWETTYAAASGRELSVVDVREPSVALSRVCAKTAQAAVVSQRPTDDALHCGDRGLALRRIGGLSMVVAAHPKNDWATRFEMRWIHRIVGAPPGHALLWSDLDPDLPARSLSLYCPTPGDELWQLFAESVGGERVALRLGCLPLSCVVCSDWLAEETGALVWARPRAIRELGFEPLGVADNGLRWRRELFLASEKSDDVTRWLWVADPGMGDHVVADRRETRAPR